MRKSALILAVVGILVLLVFAGRLYLSEADFSLENPAWSGLSGISGENIRPMYDTSGLASVSTSDTFLVVSPSRDYTSEESAQVASFLQRGGKVVVMDDFGNASSLLASINAPVSINKVPVCDYDNYHINQSFPVVTDITPSPETANVSQLIFNHPASLVISGDTYPLAMTSNTAWLDVNDNSRLDGKERMGSYCMVAKAKYGSGQLLVISDPDLLINGMTDLGDNKVFLSNILTGTIWIDAGHGREITPIASVYYALKYEPTAHILIVLLALILAIAYIKRGDIIEFLKGKLLRI